MLRISLRRKPGTRRVLVVDDDVDMCRLVSVALRARGFDVVNSSGAAHALELFRVDDFDVVLTDMGVGKANGLDLCEQVTSRSDTSVVVMTAFGCLDSAIGALRAGAYDLLLKPLSMEAVAMTLERAAQARRLRRELALLETHVRTRGSSRIVGQSPVMRELNEQIQRAAPSAASVLITGESGTGKELIAKALHDRSGRRGEFVAINCAAVPPTLLESELFGHARGAYTGARGARKGLFLEADGGTLFLDEIGELPPAVQVKLLRSLQERSVRPVGETTETPFDARIVAATNRPIEADVVERRFREDLYYRINVVRIIVPPLRARGSDVLRLAQYFLDRAAERTGKPVTRLATATAQQLVSYAWPGNVRELENCMERALALAAYDEITPDDLPQKVREQRSCEGLPELANPAELPNMQTVELRYIRKVLQRVNGNKTLAAKILGFDRRTLYRKLEALAAYGDWPSLGV